VWDFQTLGRSPGIDPIFPSPALRAGTTLLFVVLKILLYLQNIYVFMGPLPVVGYLYRWWITSWELGSWVYPSKISLYRSQIHSPWLGDMVDSGDPGIGCGRPYKPVSLCSQAGRYDNPMPELTLSPQSGTMNLSYWTLYHSWVLLKSTNL